MIQRVFRGLVVFSLMLLMASCATSVAEDLSPEPGSRQDGNTAARRTSRDGGTDSADGAQGHEDGSVLDDTDATPNSDGSTPSTPQPSIPGAPETEDGGGADAVAQAPAPPVGPPASQWKLAWSDEFDTPGSPDQATWTTESGGDGWGSDQKQFFTDKRQENVRIENGMLTIEARRECYQGRSYTSGRLISKNKRDVLFARIEVKAKLPSARGTLSEFILLPTDSSYGSWPKSGEIDIMQNVGHDSDEIQGAVQTEAYNDDTHASRSKSVTVNDATSQFHVYAVEWTKDAIKTFVDDRQVLAFANENNGASKWPFDKKFYLVFDLAVGGDWAGEEGIDENAFPQKLLVDYVRVYERT